MEIRSRYRLGKPHIPSGDPNRIPGSATFGTIVPRKGGWGNIPSLASKSGKLDMLIGGREFQPYEEGGGVRIRCTTRKKGKKTGVARRSIRAHDRDVLEGSSSRGEKKG